MTTDTHQYPSPAIAFRGAAWLGFLGVALGAFGAHWLKELLARRETTAIWEKAVLYHFFHAVVMLLTASMRPFSAASWKWFGVGIVCFSGSLYAWAITGAYWLVFVTPVGGICLLAGWFSLAVSRGSTFNDEAKDKQP